MEALDLNVPTADVFEWDAPLDVLPPLAMREAQELRRVPSRIVPGIRDLYIAARFPGVARAGLQLENVARVIEGARLLFEDREPARALELLDLAVEQSPNNEPLRLARLEIAFLGRDAPLFHALAGEFKRVCDASAEWPEVMRLGRALMPAEPLYGALQDGRAYEHYGPWPHTPNWIGASWDLTPEVLAADYHRLMRLPEAAQFDGRAPRLAA